MDIKLYNKELKEKYLEERIENEDSRNTIRYVFRGSELIEDILKKDIYNFNLPEIGKVISNLKPHSKVVAKAYGRQISRYISWAIKPMGLRENNINPLKGVEDSWYDQFIDRTLKIHWSADELYDEIINDLENAQDKALLSLIFEGVLGKGFSELREILYKHVNWNKNEITIKRDNEEKVLSLSERTMDYLEKAFDQKTYLIFNSNTGDYNEKELVSSDYLFKNVKSPRTKEGEPLSLQVFYNRMQSIRDKYSLDLLTPNSLRQSGMIYHTYLIAKEKIDKGEKAEIGYEELAIVGEKYNASKMSQNGYHYFNTHLIREYVNEQTLKDLYDIDVVMTRR